MGVLLIDKDQGHVVPDGEVQGPGGVDMAELRAQDPLQDCLHQFIQVLQQMLDFGVPVWERGQVREARGSFKAERLESGIPSYSRVAATTCEKNAPPPQAPTSLSTHPGIHASFHPPAHSFIHPVLGEHLLCAKSCARHRGYYGKQDRMVLFPYEIHRLVGKNPKSSQLLITYHVPGARCFLRIFI